MRVISLLCATVAATVAGCASFVPSSLQPGQQSASTGLPLKVSEYLPPERADYLLAVGVANPAPYADYAVLRYGAGSRLCRDTFEVRYRKAEPGEPRIPIPPGTVTLGQLPLAIDETEITNLDWRLFAAAALPEGMSRAELLPAASALPVPDYYDNPFYRLYPVVGISREQAEQYCEWRTDAVNEQFTRYHIAATVRYRLPTEAEWEEAALVRSGLPYGTNCLELPLHVAEAAAAYLQKRAATSVPVAQIRRDIAAYNHRHPSRCWINCAQAGPYFLRLASPGYVYQGPKNEYGLCQMLGNAAELVAEPGITKGGSYRDSLTACTIKGRGRVAGPAPTVGFRTVCEVKFISSPK